MVDPSYCNNIKFDNLNIEDYSRSYYIYNTLLDSVKK